MSRKETVHVDGDPHRAGSAHLHVTQRFPDPFLERDPGLPAERFACAGGVEDRHRHVEGARDQPLDREIAPEIGRDGIRDLVQRVPDTGADVEVALFGMGSGSHEGVHCIVDVKVIARDRSIPEDADRFAGERTVGKVGHGSKDPRKALTGPVQVPHSQRDRREPGFRRGLSRDRTRPQAWTRRRPKSVEADDPRERVSGTGFHTRCRPTRRTRRGRRIASLWHGLDQAERADDVDPRIVRRRAVGLGRDGRPRQMIDDVSPGEEVAPAVRRVARDPAVSRSTAGGRSREAWLHAVAVTEWPASSKARTRARPRNPLAPVTTTFMVRTPRSQRKIYGRRKVGHQFDRSGIDGSCKAPNRRRPSV